MSRLYDRILAFGCEALRPYHLVSDEQLAEATESLRTDLEAQRDDFSSDEAFEEFVSYTTSAQGRASTQPRSTEVLDSNELHDRPVVVADDVAAYCRQLGEVDITEVLTTVAPPFDRCFIEFQGAKNQLDFFSWGLLVDDVTSKIGGDKSDEIGWHVMFRLVAEKRKNAPIGPVVTYVYALDREGLMMLKPGVRNELISSAWLPSMTPESPPGEVMKVEADRLLQYVLPGLMATSFMHCRNVEVEEVEPPEKQSRNWKKKRGDPLTRFHTLKIDQMRSVLDSQGNAREGGLGDALHICRGHFKTFTEDAPLFGRATGTFWWANHVRGSADQGVVVKDYEVPAQAPGLGRPYQDADESPAVAEGQTSGRDPDLASVGLAAHNTTQNLLASIVADAGFAPRRPSDDEPRYDLAWAAHGRINVAEVKSLTPMNEERQLRLAIGQVVRYRQQLSAGGGPVQALIATSEQPSDDSWLDLCNQYGIILCWPEVMKLAVTSAEAGAEVGSN